MIDSFDSYDRESHKQRPSIEESQTKATKEAKDYFPTSQRARELYVRAILTRDGWQGSKLTPDEEKELKGYLDANHAEQEKK